MKLEINIDEKEFGIDIADHFQDFFKRLRAEIKSRLVSNDTLVCGNYELEIIEMFLTAFKNATIEQQPSRDIEEIEEVINCDADAETKCKMISNILASKPHYFKEPQEMTIDEAIDILEEVKELDDSIYQYNIKYLKAFEMAIKALEAWNNLFKSYEVLVDSITDLTATEATERIDKWCIEQLRGILGDYYANRIEKEILEAQADGDDYKYIKSISNPTGIEFDIDIPKKIESYEKLLKHPVIKHIMDMDETQEQIDFVKPHKRIPVTLTVNDDAISRQAAIDANCYNCSIKANGGKCSKCDVVKAIENLPPVKPQERTGHWILLDECSNSGYYCSECHKKVVKEGWSNTVKKIKYCPNCGKKMEEVEK